MLNRLTRSEVPMTTSHSTEIRPFRLEISDAQITDLHDRLSRARWAYDPDERGWSRGVPASYLRIVAEYWRDGYDWRGQEAALNERPQFTTTIDGQPFHF